MEEEELNRGILKQRWSLQRQRKKKKIGGPSRGTDTVKGVTEKRNLVGKSGIQNDELSTRGITKRENEKKKKKQEERVKQKKELWVDCLYVDVQEEQVEKKVLNISSHVSNLFSIQSYLAILKLKPSIIPKSI